MIKWRNFFFYAVLIVILFIVPIAGCIQITPAADEDQNEQEVTDQQTGKPVIGQFSASPSVVTEGDSTTVSWTVTNAETVTIEPGIGSVALSGSTSVSPSTTMVYTITATNSAGTTTATTEVSIASAPEPETPPASPPTVVVGALPEIGYFTADPDSIGEDQSSTLSWNVSNADSVEISPGVGNVAPAGSETVSPDTTTTYTLTATNSYGWRSETIEVNVSTLSLSIPIGPITVFQADLVPVYIYRHSLTEYSVLVKNEGAIASLACKIQLKSPSLSKYVSCPSIEAGEDALIPFTLAQDKVCSLGGSSFKITALVDTSDSVNEIDEENNNYTRTFTCY
jgi:hypothetical protein